MRQKVHIRFGRDMNAAIISGRRQNFKLYSINLFTRREGLTHITCKYAIFCTPRRRRQRVADGVVDGVENK